MASPLSLGLAAALALCSTTVLACEGQGCWGMAPAQEKNPGYTGPDYAALYGPGGPPPVYGYGYGAGEGYDGSGDGDAYGGDGGLPYAGPVEGYPAPYQNADGSAPAYGPEDAYGPPPADDGYGYDGGPVVGGGSGPHGPPQDPSLGAMYDAGPIVGGGSGPHGPPSGPYAGASPYYAPPVGSGPHGPPSPAYGSGPAYGADEPYEGYSSRGYEAYGETPYDPSGYRERSYRAGSRSKYVYDSGWRIQEGPADSYAYGAYDGGMSVYGPAGYGPPPEMLQGRSRSWSEHRSYGPPARRGPPSPPMAQGPRAPMPQMAPPPPAPRQPSAPQAGMPAHPVPYDQLGETYDGPSMDRTGERG